MKLLKYEAKKILIKQYALFLFAAVILIKLISLPEQLETNYGFNSSAEKNAYLEMLKPLSGMLTEENEALITDMKEQLIEAQSLSSQLFDAYQSEDAELIAELEKRLEEYKDILKNENAIERIFEQYSYVSEDREVRALIPVKKVGVMENASVNYLFLLCICFCCAYAVMVEQGGKAEVIIRTTPNGQGKTMAAKIGILLAVISISALVLSLTDLTALSFQLPKEYWQYSVHSLESFKNCPINISVIGVFAAVQLMRLTGTLFVGSAAMVTAHFNHNYAASIFPFAAVPIIADYVSEQDSQSYFLPTGLLKGWGYFYGDVADPYNWEMEYIIFHKIPLGYTAALTALSLLFVIGSAVILIHSGKNGLARKGGKALKAAALGMTLMLLSSCSAESSDVIEEYGGSVSIYPEFFTQNSRYSFKVENLPYIDQQDRETYTNTLNITDKETGRTEEYPFDPFEGQMIINNLFASEDCLLFSCNKAIMRLDLEDFSLTTVYAEKGPKRIVFGLVFDFGEEELRFDPEGAFTDGKTIYIYDRFSGIAKPEPGGGLKVLLSDDTSRGLEFDGKAFYYISADDLLHKYDIASGKNTVIYEGKADTYSLKGDREKIYFQSDGIDVVLDKADMK